MPPKDPTLSGASEDSQHDAESEVSAEETTKSDGTVLSSRDEKLAALLVKKQENSDGEAVTHPRESEEFESENSDKINSLKQENSNNLDKQEGVDEDPKSKELPNASESLAEVFGDQIFLKDGVATVKLKINGVVTEKPFDQVVSITQKNLLADNRLREASQKERSLSDRESLIADREKQLNERLAHLPHEGAERNSDEQEAQARSFVDTLIDGDRSDAVEEAVKMLGDRVSLDPEEIATRAAEAATAKVLGKIERENALTREADFEESMALGIEQVRSQYPEVLQDDLLFDAVDRRCETLADAHPDLSPAEVMVMAAKEVNDRLLAASENTGTPNRKALKDNLTRLPKPSANALQSAPKIEAPKTARDVVAAMRESRGRLAGR